MRATILASLLVVASLPAVVLGQDSSDSDEGTGSSLEQEATEDGFADGPGEEASSELASLSAGLSPAISSSAIAGRKKLEKIRESFEDEPGIEDVQEAALEFYGIEEGRINKYSNQAAIKNLAPKLSAQFRRNVIDTDIRKKDFINYGDQVAGLDNVEGDVDEFTVSGTWNLPKLIYNPEKLELASLRKLRERVLKEVTRLYYLRRRLKITFMLDPPEDASTRARKQIRIQKTESMINAMTDGVYEDWNEVDDD